MEKVLFTFFNLLILCDSSNFGLPKPFFLNNNLNEFSLKNFTSSIESFQSSFNDEVCVNQLISFTSALSNREFWALQLFDTWAKIQSGFLSGNIRNIGDFDSCVRFRHETPTNGIIQGQHCHVGIVAMPNSTLEGAHEGFDWREFANWLRISEQAIFNSFCLPASCTPEIVVGYLNEQFLIKNDLVGVWTECQTNDPLPFEVIDVVAIIAYSIFLIKIIIDTIYDLRKRSKNQEQNKFWSSFSVYTNGMKLFDITKNKSPSSINSMNGLRVLSILWIIIGHREFIQFDWGNPKDHKEFMKTPQSFLLHTFPLAVDTFFVLGAALMTFSTLRDCDKGQLSIGRMVWRRYLRYTPALAALILFVMSIGKFFLNGPYLFTKVLRGGCSSSWWLALLHVQNHIDPEQMCLGHTWYLSADFQLFIISPFVIYFIHKYGKKLLMIPIILLLITIIYVTTISAIFGIPMNSGEYFVIFYYPTESRAGPWFIGMILGYFLYQHRGKTFKINSLINSAAWIGSFAVQISILMLTYNFAVTSNISQAAHTSFMALHRNIWAATMCWIIFACQHLKTGGIVRWFLSLPQWQPIARMGLSMYLIHPVYQLISVANQRVPLYMTFWQFIPTFLSDVMITFILATISYLSFEAPVLIMEEYFYKKWKNRHSKT